METYLQSSWSLEDLYPSQKSVEMQLALADLESASTRFERRRAMLTVDIAAEDFMEIVYELESLNRLAYKINEFAGLSFSADTQDQGAQAFLSQIQQIMADFENRIMFFSLWWKEIDQAAALRLLETSGDFRYWLEQIRLFKPHTLTEPEEKIVNIKNSTGSNALINLYDSITNRYIFRFDVDGHTEELTRGELMIYARSHRADLRAAAYQELYKVYGQDGPVLGQIYQTLVRDWKSEQVDLRKFPSPIAARNLLNNIPDPVVDTLLDVCQRNASLFQRFFRVKARMLGMKQLRRYDIYAPLAKSEKKYSFDESAHLVFDSFRRFDPQLERLARRVFDQGHLDSEVRKSKRGGAFCDTVGPDLTPWVLVNFQGNPEDVATLAHELGHAVHSMLAEHHNLYTQQPSLPLAETASTFGEIMLIDRLLEQEDDETVRRELLFRQVDDAYATIMRQAFFASFERQAHGMVLQGATVEDISNEYMNNLGAQFGDSVDIAPEFRWEWVSIPHIYRVPFYVYAYSFGQLLVLSLYRQFKAEGDQFKPRYLKLLSAGGSQSPEKILDAAGIDIHSPTFWQGGFDVIAGLIDQFDLVQNR